MMCCGAVRRQPTGERSGVSKREARKRKRRMNMRTTHLLMALQVRRRPSALSEKLDLNELKG
jgi:hypothetical protein